MSSGEFQLVLLVCFVLSFVSCWNLKCRDHLCKSSQVPNTLSSWFIPGYKVIKPNSITLADKISVVTTL